jgi:hypothetical protein
MRQPSAAFRGSLGRSHPSAPRQEAARPLDAVPAALLSRLEQELTSLSSLTVHALTSVRGAVGSSRSARPSPPGETTGQWLALAAEALDSAIATHQALLGGTATTQDER